MKKWIVRIIITILIIGAFAGVGMVTYRVGYQQGAQGTANGLPFMFGHSGRFNQGSQFRQDDMPQVHPGMNNGFDHNFMPGFGGSRFNVMNHGRSFGFFSPFHFLFNIILVGLVIWLGYKLFKGNGWQLSLSRQSASSEAAPDEPKKKKAKSKD